jgi:hypothetical protein
MSAQFVSSPDGSFGSIMEDFEGWPKEQELRHKEQLLARREKELLLREMLLEKEKEKSDGLAFKFSPRSLSSRGSMTVRNNG